MRSTQLRRDHILGMMTGVAIGDALGYPRVGLSRRQAVKLFGSGPCQYSFYRGVGVTGFNTAQLFMAAQSIVSSGTELERFGKTLLKRLGWYAISFPTDMKSASRRIGLKSWFSWARSPRPSSSSSNEPVVRSVLLVLALHNTNLGTRNWIEHSARTTHQDPHVIHGCHILAGLTNLIINERGVLNAPAAARFLSDGDWSSEYRKRLKELAEHLDKGSRTSIVARHFGWSDGIPNSIVPTVIMSIYCFLRHHKDFSKAVNAAVRLGGDASTMGAVVGALAGAHLGINKIPAELITKLSDKGYGPSWMEDMAQRLAEWPHGADDLLDAPALPANPLSILSGNLFRHTKHLTQAGRHAICKLLTSSPARHRRSNAAK